MPLSIKPTTPQDAEEFIRLRKQLFTESQFMLYEPEEYRPTLERETRYMAHMSKVEHSNLLLAYSDDILTGFAGAEGSSLKKRRHVATVFMGVLKTHWKQEIGTALLTKLIEWAPTAGIERLELTAGEDNTPALNLYKKFGFKQEGVAREAIHLQDRKINELMLGLILTDL